MKNISCMTPEIWSTTDGFFSRFGPFFARLHPLPPINQENQNFEKMEKALEISSFNTSVPNKVIICRCHKELRLP